MRFAWVTVVALACALGAARADTGGSMGGGDWGSHSSSSSSSSSRTSYTSYTPSSSPSSSSSSWSSSSSGGSYSSSSSGSGGDLGAGTVILLIIGFLVCCVIGLWWQNRDSYSSGGGLSLGLPEYIPTVNTVDVTVLRIALDGRARKFVQTELARIGKGADTATREGRATMLREVGVMLRRLRDAWIYGGAVNESMRELSLAKASFDKHVDDARSRFRDETVRNEQGKVATSVAPESVPHAEEGDGVILVSIVVAAHTELFTVAHIGAGEDLRKALEAAAYRDPADLVAIEIVWQPSEDGDRMSSLELEAKYPKPQLIKIQGALVGKAFCAYCGGPFPAELVSCPHCGAPARKDSAAA